MKFKLKHNLTSPKGYDSYSLFEFCVNKLIQKMNNEKYPINLNEGKDAAKNHIQWSNLIFGLGNETNVHYLSKVKSDFAIYFINIGNKYKWNFERIYKEHPQFFKIDNPEVNNDPFFEMLKALDHEIIESKKETRKNTYHVLEIKRILLTTYEQIYLITIDIEDDEDPKFIEDLPITIRVGGLAFETKVLDYDKISCQLYFQLEKDLLKFSGLISVETDAAWILEKIKERLQNYQNNILLESPISKYWKNCAIPQILSDYSIDNNIATLGLDDSQLKAYDFSNKHDLTIIWGPPGTGKSHTLASIIDNFYKKSERTLITCTANVAVDSIIIKLIDLIEKQQIKVKQGEILRIGHTRDKRLLETEYLFPKNETTKKIRERILHIDEKLQNIAKGHELELKKERQDLRDKLKKEINTLIQNSLITFATASKFFVDISLNNKEYDNLIIDEASMVSIPHFIALGLTIKKRIIIAGDFRQLGPVVLSQSEVSKKWLHRDIFEFIGINPKEMFINHLAMIQLLIQRRSHESICNLINKPFYQGKLKTVTNFDNDKIVHIKPFEERIIAYKKLDKINEVEFTKKGSRLNRNSANEIISLLDLYSQYEMLNNTIGILTPYRGQVKLLQELIAQRNYKSKFRELIKIGTIHAFQGSECDLIIFDTVDSKSENIGRLYRFDIGKRLVNVALSRAKYKLIVVGDLEIFTNGKGVELSLQSIFKTLIRYQTK